MRRSTVTGVAASTVASAAGAWWGKARADAVAVREDPHAAELRAPDTAPVRTTVTTADGAELNVEMYGPPDAPALVFIHGWTCCAAYWNPQVRAFSADHRVIVYDQRGHGASTSGARRFGPDVLADDLQDVLEATLGRERRAVLVGHSMGAITIVAWAGRHPEQVSRRAAGALLASTATDAIIAESLVVKLPTRLPRLTGLIGEAVVGVPTPLGGPSPLAYRFVRYAALSKSATPAQVDFCERIILRCRATSRGRWGRALAHLDVSASVSRLTVPTSVLVGTADRLTPPAHARRLADTLEADGTLVEFIELDGVGHMSTVEAVPEANAAIEKLLEQRTVDAAG